MLKEHAVKKSRFTDEQIAYAMKQAETGTVDAETGWVAGDYLGLDQGPILGMLASYRNGTIWPAMRKSPNIVRGLKRAGFSGGWLDRAGA